MLPSHLGKCQPLGIEGTDAKGLSPAGQEEEHRWAVHGWVWVARTLQRNPGCPRARSQLRSALALERHGNIGETENSTRLLPTPPELPTLQTLVSFS